MKRGNVVIMLADDAKDNHFYLDSIFRHSSVALRHAYSGRQAIEMLKDDNNIDMILMDILMPDIDGEEATKKIREFNQSIPILAQTAYFYRGGQSTFDTTIFDDVIQKPFTKRILIRHINKYTNKILKINNQSAKTTVLAAIA